MTIVHFPNLNVQISSEKLAGRPKHYFSPSFYRHLLHLWTAFLVARNDIGKIITERNPKIAIVIIAAKKKNG